MLFLGLTWIMMNDFDIEYLTLRMIFLIRPSGTVSGIDQQCSMTNFHLKDSAMMNLTTIDLL